MVRDLFGEIPVYFHDIDAWLRAVPRIEPGSPRAARYVADYAVVEKIKAAKARGEFERICAAPEAPSPFWWRRFGWTKG